MCLKFQLTSTSTRATVAMASAGHQRAFWLRALLRGHTLLRVLRLGVKLKHFDEFFRDGSDSLAGTGLVLPTTPEPSDWTQPARVHLGRNLP